MRVARGRRHAFVAEQFLEFADVSSLFVEEQIRRAVPEAAVMTVTPAARQAVARRRLKA